MAYASAPEKLVWWPPWEYRLRWRQLQPLNHIRDALQRNFFQFDFSQPTLSLKATPHNCNCISKHKSKGQGIEGVTWRNWREGNDTSYKESLICSAGNSVLYQVIKSKKADSKHSISDQTCLTVSVLVVEKYHVLQVDARLLCDGLQVVVFAPFVDLDVVLVKHVF